MKIRIWGTRGSVPTPITSEAIENKIRNAILNLPPDFDPSDETAVNTYLQNMHVLDKGTAGGNTTCIQIEADDYTLIIDAGSGLRALGHELMRGPCGQGKGKLYFLFTHTHWDHLQGFPFFIPAFIPGNELYFYSVHDVQNALQDQQQYRYFPISLSYMQANMTFIPIQVGRPFNIGPIKVNTIENAHPGKAYSYRVEDQDSIFVHASDSEYKKLDADSVQPHVAFFRDADALIFDAQYTLRETWHQKVDWGHSSAMIGVDLARAAGVKRLLLFHHDPTYSDEELQKIQRSAIEYQKNQDSQLPTCAIEIAYEGMVLDLSPPPSLNVNMAEEGDTAIIVPGRVVDPLGAEQLIQQIEDLESAHGLLNPILDLMNVETLTTPGLQALINFRQKHADIPLVLAAPSENIRQIIHIAGYDDYLPIYPTVEQARAAIQARESLNLPGQIVNDRYQIQHKIYQDRLITIIKALDTHNEDREVILRIFNQSFSEGTLQRIFSQTQQLTNLEHPNIIRTLDWHQDSKLSYIVEEFIAGQTLQAKFNEEGNISSAAPQIAQDILAALEYAHSRGIIHSGLTPTNILVTDDGVKIAGFGQGRVEEGRDLKSSPLRVLPAAYLAPEQILGQALDARTDLYAFGLILYQLFTGKYPYEGDGDEILIDQHLYGLPNAVRQYNPHLSRSLEHFIFKLLDKNPNDRYANAQQARRILGSLMAHTEDVALQRWSAIIGREPERQILQSLWEQAQAKQGKLAFISGESGIGKTSLAQQLATRNENAVLLIGSSDGAEKRAAYHLFTDMLRSYLATVPPELFYPNTKTLLANFVRLIPEIQQMLPDIDPPPALDPEAEQIRLMTSLMKFIERATSERAWLLILENLHWADQSSLEVLQYLCHHLPKMRLMIIGTYRSLPLNSGHPLLSTLRDLNTFPSYQQISLERLPVTAVSQILSHLWQQDAPEEWVQKIYDVTGGNPFYVKEVAKGLIDNNLITQQNGRWHFPDLEEVQLPASVNDVVWSRIHQLSPDTQELLRQTSVLGQTFRFDELQAITGFSEWDVLEHLDTALERQLVQEVSGGTMLRFSHAEIQHVLYDSLNTLRRRLLHRKVADWYEQTHLSQFDESQHEELPTAVQQLIPLIVYHYHHAQDPDRERHYSYIAGTYAATQFANSEAISYFSRALELTPATALIDCYNILVRRERIYGLQGQREAQRRDLLRLQELITNLPPQDKRTPHCKASVFLRQAHYANAVGEYSNAIDTARTAIEWAQIANDISIKAQAYLQRGRALGYQGEYKNADEQFSRALALAQQTSLPQLQADSLLGLGTIAMFQHNYELAPEYFEKARDSYRRIGNRQEEIRAVNNLGVCYHRLGVYVTAKEHFEESLLISREIGARAREGMILGYLGHVLSDLGVYDTARRYLQEAINVSEDIDEPRDKLWAQIFLSLSYHHQGDNHAARKYADSALRTAQDLGERKGHGYALITLGHALTELQQFDKATIVYTQAMTHLKQLGEENLVMEPLAGLARISLLRKNVEDAQDYIDRIRMHLQSNSIYGTMEPFRVYLTCYYVLKAIGDPGAQVIIGTAYHLLQARASLIEDDSFRQSFLAGTPTHQEIFNIWTEDE
ncbi:MAG TPA: tetratricopeptide repeat protein [Anaerolineae bacterium]|nr:tetratricopeptide repeat protein [Anaerolineae bacterium]